MADVRHALDGRRLSACICCSSFSARSHLQHTTDATHPQLLHTLHPQMKQATNCTTPALGGSECSQHVVHTVPQAVRTNCWHVCPGTSPSPAGSLTR
jgi:hypothetical protein